MLLVVEHTHPSLDGHFPGRPIVPAAVILDLVIQHVAAAHAQHSVAGVKRAKWLRPLRPSEVFELELEPMNNSHVRFRCHVRGELMAEGNLAMQQSCSYK